MNKRQVVVVTGASGGIGRAVVRAFAARGASVALLARGETGLQAAADDVERAGGKPFVLPTDVADYEQVLAAGRAAESALGPIDVWVNVAFTSVFSPFTKIRPDEYKRITEVSYLGYVYGTMAALELMGPADKGSIVQVGSALAYRGIPLQTAYCGAKHAIQGRRSTALRAPPRGAASTSPWFRCPQSIPHSSAGCCLACPSTPNRSHRSTNPKSPRKPFCTRQTTRPPGVLGRRQHRRNPRRQRRRTRPAGPLSGTHRF